MMSLWTDLYVPGSEEELSVEVRLLYDVHVGDGYLSALLTRHAHHRPVLQHLTPYCTRPDLSNTNTIVLQSSLRFVVTPPEGHPPYLCITNTNLYRTTFLTQPPPCKVTRLLLTHFHCIEISNYIYLKVRQHTISGSSFAFIHVFKKWILLYETYTSTFITFASSWTRLQF